jgi:hypothetical protein
MTEDLHTCHNECHKPLCQMRRELDRANAIIAEYEYVMMHIQAHLEWCGADDFFGVKVALAEAERIRAGENNPPVSGAV